MQQPAQERKACSIPTRSVEPVANDPLLAYIRQVFMEKIEFCSQVLNINDETQPKRLIYLYKLNQQLKVRYFVVNIVLPHLDIIFEMIQKNIFRPLPIQQSRVGNIGIDDDDDEFVNPAWIHLQPVYEYFLSLIENEAISAKSLKIFINQKFVYEFLQLFDSEDPREREYLLRILHMLYAKLIPQRLTIRKAVNDCFYRLIHETNKFNGAAQLLDRYSSFLGGQEEKHVDLFKNVIIPLHKIPNCQLFHDWLWCRSMVFLSKLPSQATLLVEGLLRYWPFDNSVKEVLFLQELLEVLELCEITKLENLIPKLFKRLIKCIAGPHLQVADRAMCFFENDYFLAILKSYKEVAFPLLVPVISQIADTYWHKVLQESLNALKTFLKEIDNEAFEKALNKIDPQISYLLKDQKTQQQDRQKIEDKWKKLIEQAKKINPNFIEPVVPYQDSHIVGEHNGFNNGNITII